jgi:hypothetical protein
MKPRPRVLVPGIAVLAAAAIAAAVLAAGRPERPSSRNGRWRQDIAYLASELPRVHVGGLLRVRRSAWDTAAARLEAAVPHLTDGQIIVGMARMVAMLHDDETLLIMPRTAGFPLGVYWFGQQLRLTAVPRADRELLGAEIVAADGHPIGQVLGLIGSVIDHQDAGLLRDEEVGYLESYSPLLSWLGLTRTPRTLILTVITLGGAHRTMRLAAATRVRADDDISVPAPLYRQNAGKPYWLRILGSEHAVYLKYNSCVDDGGFQRLAAQALAVLRRNPSYRLIVDLRDNGGGDTQPFTFLTGALRADPALHRPDRVFGLVNQQTDSSATLDASSLGQIPNALLIGQQPGDPIDEYGNEQFLTLPNSKLQVIYTTKVVNPGARPLAAPDLVITPTIRQVLAGQDPVLAAALSYGR